MHPRRKSTGNSKSIKKINCDITAHSVVRSRRKKKTLTLKSGHMLHNEGNEISSESVVAVY